MVARSDGRRHLVLPDDEIVVLDACDGIMSADAIVARFGPFAAVPQGILHETAHALVIDRHGRRVGAAGFGFYWGELSFFVDATDALMLPRRHRMSQALARPCSDLVVGGVLAFVARRTGPTDTGLLLRVVAVLTYLNVLINLVPLLQLDGYWFLADVLDESQLRQKSLQALRHPRSAAGRSQRGLVVYAAASIVFGVLLLMSGAAVWLTELLLIATTAFHTSLPGAGGAVIFVALYKRIVALEAEVVELFAQAGG